MRGSAVDGNKVGSSGLAGVHTKVLFGDPSKAGFYSILLFVPAHTSIQAHSHRDDRMATVVTGAWYFGYGDHFDVRSLKKLPPGSVYSEPGARNHFARTDKDAVIVQISGYGPTDTRYFTQSLPGGLVLAPVRSSACTQHHGVSKGGARERIAWLTPPSADQGRMVESSGHETKRDPKHRGAALLREHCRYACTARGIG